MGLREKRKQRFREAILEAALDVFSDRGYHDAQVSDIAARAEVAVGTVYNLFKNKEDLYGALLLQHAEEIAAAFSETFEREDEPLERLRAFIRVKGKLLQENDKVLRLFFDENQSRRLHVRAMLSDHTRSMYDSLIGQLAEVFEAAIAAGYIDRDLDPLELALTLDSVTNTLAFLGLDQPEKHPYPSKVDRIERMLFGSILTERGEEKLSQPSGEY